MSRTRSATPAQISTSTDTAPRTRKTPLIGPEGVKFYLTLATHHAGNCSWCDRYSEHLTAWRAVQPMWFAHLCRRCTDRRTRKKL